MTMVRAAVSALVVAAVVSGCAAPRPAPVAEPQPAAVPRPATITPEPVPPPAPAPRKPVSAPPASRPLPKTGASGATQPKPAAQTPTPAAKPAAESAKAPTLDLGSLEQRLKDTKAIGVFTKLSLKNQVDDLLGELRAFHQGSAKTPAAALRQKYDTLIIKVLSLLQNGDPQLAAAIASSREALWGILMDPQKFSQI